jgi:hypothetical protein
MHELGGVLLVVGLAPALAEGTSGIKPTGKAESVTTAKFEVLVSWVQGVARHKVKRVYMMKSTYTSSAEGQAQTRGATIREKTHNQDIPTKGQAQNQDAIDR